MAQSSTMPSVKLGERKGGDVQHFALLKYRDDETLADFRRKLSNGVIEYPFDFWDDRLPGRVKEAAEKLCLVEEMEGTLVVIRREDPVVTELLCVDPIGEPSLGTDVVNVSESVSESIVYWESELMKADVLKVWKDQVSGLQRWMKNEGLEDHKWRIKTWDEGELVLGHLDCRECRVTSSLSGPKAISAKHIKNVFNNFKFKHVKTDKHYLSFCGNRGISTADISKRDVVSPGVIDHAAQIKEGKDIVKLINDNYDGPKTPFEVIDPKCGSYTIDKAFLYKVRCKYCSQVFELCPRNKNLERNLLTHLESQKHQDARQITTISNEFSSAVRSGKRGRPKAPDARDMAVNDNALLKFFSVKERDPASASSSKGLDLGLTFLCWGYWSKSVIWDGPVVPPVVHSVKPLLDDQAYGKFWYCEPTLQEVVYNPTTEAFCIIEGTFRHKDCARLTQLGGGFKDLMCSHCAGITLLDDFRGRVNRETKNEVKRGSRDTGAGRRLGYLTRTELAKHSRELNVLHRRLRLSLLSTKQQVCALRVSKQRLDDMLGRSAESKDLKSFLKNIVNAHQKGAFGGREGLWAFLKDVGQNILRAGKGARYTNKTKAIAQAMLQFGGRQVAHVFSLNLNGPSLKTLKREKAKLVPFRTGFRIATFKEVCRILAGAKKHIGITVDVPVILAEDETRIKPRPRWEAKNDVLIGFCGAEGDNHECSFGLEVVVGSGEDGYDNIVSTFKNYVQGMYARVIIVNPLHESLPRLALCAISTCNRFSADWVRRQWIKMKQMWDLYCRDEIGPLIGHASDGDARRRKLMIEDYLGKSSTIPRYCVGWEGWTMSVCVLSNGDRYGFGDQDQPHNGKKLVNPLDRVSNLIVLGESFACLSHVEKVYNVYTQDEHGLCYDDIQRTDRQNWAGPQRLCSRKVQDLLHALSFERTAHEMHEKTLGTMFYLEICGDYIDIFFSMRLGIRERVVLAAKVSFFFRLWRLWLKFGDHSVTGNRSVSEKNMVSIQAFHDVNMSCHFIVLLVCYFRDKFSSLCIPFHLLGSDCVEIFFSKVGGMSGHERNYDFGALIDSATGINRLSCFEFGDEGLKIGRSHKKQDHIWGRIHPLVEGEAGPDLFDYSAVGTNELIVEALQEGLGLAREILVKLNMSPLSSKPVSERRWWLAPWEVEAETWVNEVSNLGDVAPEDDEVEAEPVVPRQEPSEDDPEAELETTDEWDTPRDPRLAEMSRELVSPHDVCIDDDNEIEVLAHEVRHVLSETLSAACEVSGKVVYIPTVSFQGRVIYKSTLVSQLAHNVHLSKDRLTRVKTSLYISGVKRKEMEGAETRMVDIGIDCAVVFEKQSSRDVAGTRASTATRKTRGKKLEQGSKTKERRGMQETMKREFWIGRVQMIKRKHNGSWKKSRWPVDLLDRGVENTIQLLFYWYKPIGNSKVKYSYDTNDLVWIELESVISSVTMKFQNGSKPHWVLHLQDKVAIDNFMADIDK